MTSSGPFVSTFSRPSEFFYQEKRRTLGKGKRRSPLAYKKQYARQVVTVSQETSPPNAVSFASQISSEIATSPAMVLVSNKAYGRFADAVRSQAQWAVNLIEYEQSAQMLMKRSHQLIEIVKAVNRFDILAAVGAVKSALNATGIDWKRVTPPKSKARAYAMAKDAAGLFLEYKYGWAPLVEDLWTSALILSGERKKSASKSASLSLQYFPSLNNVFQDTSTGAHKKILQLQRVYDCRLSCRIGAGVQVSNPNLVFWNEMGLVNPISWVWEVIPYSHVADWFGNFGQLIDSYTDFLGLDLTEPYSTVFIKASYSDTRIAIEEGGGAWTHEYTQLYGDGLWMARDLSITKPRFQSTYQIPTLNRAAQAVAMLVNLLPKR